MARLFQIEAPCLAAPVRGRRGAARRVRAHFRGLSLAGHATATLSRKQEMGRKKAQRHKRRGTTMESSCRSTITVRIIRKLR
jgi:hypothetical protein